jgi:hypothetical protein
LSDLIARLRNIDSYGVWNEAADEIEKLRAENSALTVFRAEFAHRNAELWERARQDKERLDWLLDNIRQTDLMLMLPKYTGDRRKLYAAIDAAMRNHSEPVQNKPPEK